MAVDDGAAGTAGVEQMGEAGNEEREIRADWGDDRSIEVNAIEKIRRL